MLLKLRQLNLVYAPVAVSVWLDHGQVFHGVEGLLVMQGIQLLRLLLLFFLRGAAVV